MKAIKAKCLFCKRRIDIGNYTGTYSLHNNKSGEVCTGSSQQIPKELITQVKKPSQASRSNRSKSKPAEPSASLIAQFEVNQKITIQKSMKEELEVRKASQVENSSNRSVRSINAGLPTLGKR